MFQKRPKNKFGAKKTQCSLNHFHPSALEASVCEILVLRERAGEIRNIKYQATVHLAYGIKWRVDWSFEEKLIDRETISTPDMFNWMPKYAEAKGVETVDYKLKLRMWREGCGPAPLEIWKGSASRPMLVEVVHPKRGE